MDNIISEYINLLGGKNKNNYVRSRYLESYEDYKNKIVPHAKKNKHRVIDIINGNKDQDQILYQDEHFILIPDIKWNGKDKLELRILAFFKDKNLLSMRDLTGDNIAILQHVKNKSCQIIKEKFNLVEDQLKIFFHYHPTIWRLHLHFMNILFRSPSSSIERAHSIYSTIENLKLDSNYFKKVKIHIFNDFNI